MFDLYGNERLTEWRKFRDSLEISQTPFEDLIGLWSRAPFVNPYLNPHAPETWPDPWHLVLDSKLDDLAIVLGMLYTVQLTQRFMRESLEIHMTMPDNEKHPRYFLIVGNHTLVDYQTRTIEPYNHEFNKIWTSFEIL